MPCHRQSASKPSSPTAPTPHILRDNPTHPAYVVHLHPGDILLAFTDGVTEALNTAGAPQHDDITFIVIKVEP